MKENIRELWNVPSMDDAMKDVARMMKLHLEKDNEPFHS
jgi:hypothetical protein